MKRVVLAALIAAFVLPSSALAGGGQAPGMPSRAAQVQAVHVAQQYPLIERWLARYPAQTIKIELGFKFPQWAVTFYAPSTRDYGFLHRGHLVEVATVEEDMTPRVTFAQRFPFTPDVGGNANDDLSSTVGGLVPGWLWIVLAALFIVGLVNWRRIRDWRTVDLAVIGAGFLPAFYLYGSHHAEACVIAIYPPLAYLAVRFGAATIKPRAIEKQWLPSTPPFLLAGAAFGLAVVRVALMFTRGRIYDIGIFGQLGAHQILHGRLPYGLLAQNPTDRGDVYGPVNYLGYLWTLPAGHHLGPQLAAIGFDLGTVVLLVVAGKRLAGWNVAAAFAFSWLANPFTLYVLMQVANDSLVALLLAGALAVVSWPWLRGALLALAAWTKLGPAALLPLWIAPVRERGQALKALGGAAGVSIVMGALFLLGGHPLREVHQFYSATVSWEFARQARDPLSVWAYAPIGFFSHAFSPSLTLERQILTVALVVCGIALLALRRVSAPRLAAGSVALLASVQIDAPYWFFNYLVWLVPLLAAAVFADQPEKKPVPARRMKIRENDTASMAKKRAASSAGRRRKRKH